MKEYFRVCCLSWQVGNNGTTIDSWLLLADSGFGFGSQSSGQRRRFALSLICLCSSFLLTTGNLAGSISFRL